MQSTRIFVSLLLSGPTRFATLLAYLVGLSGIPLKTLTSEHTCKFPADPTVIMGAPKVGTHAAVPHYPTLKGKVDKHLGCMLADILEFAQSHEKRYEELHRDWHELDVKYHELVARNKETERLLNEERKHCNELSHQLTNEKAAHEQTRKDAATALKTEKDAHDATKKAAEVAAAAAAALLTKERQLHEQTKKDAATTLKKEQDAHAATKKAAEEKIGNLNKKIADLQAENTCLNNDLKREICGRADDRRKAAEVLAKEQNAHAATKKAAEEKIGNLNKKIANLQAENTCLKNDLKREIDGRAEDGRRAAERLAKEQNAHAATKKAAEVAATAAAAAAALAADILKKEQNAHAATKQEAAATKKKLEDEIERLTLLQEKPMADDENDTSACIKRLEWCGSNWLGNRNVVDELRKQIELARESYLILDSRYWGDNYEVRGEKKGVLEYTYKELDQRVVFGFNDTIAFKDGKSWNKTTQA